MQQKNKKIILFGAGGGGEAFISNNKKNGGYEILAIADNDRKKQGKYLHNYIVIKPEEILNYKYDFIIIASGFVQEIEKQLITELKIESSEIIDIPKAIIGTGKTYRPFEDKKTLELARTALVSIVQILEENQIRYFIDHGTLLGIVRDGDIITWDDDIDISIHEDDIYNLISCMKDNISNLPMNDYLEWSITVYYNENDIPQILLLTFDVNNKTDFRKFPIAIVTNIFKDGYAVQDLTYAPEYHFKSSETINYKHGSLKVPYDYEKYLEFHYGEWKIPKKDISFYDLNNYKTPNIMYKKDISQF